MGIHWFWVGAISLDNFWFWTRCKLSERFAASSLLKGAACCRHQNELQLDVICWQHKRQKTPRKKRGGCGLQCFTRTVESVPKPCSRLTLTSKGRIKLSESFTLGKTMYDFMEGKVSSISQYLYSIRLNSPLLL